MQTTKTIYIALKSRIESRVHYAPEPAWGVETRTLPQSTVSIKPLALTDAANKYPDIGYVSVSSYIP